VIHFDISNIKKEILELESKTNAAGFWDNPETSTIVVTKMRRLQNKLDNFKSLESELNNLKELNELLILELDEEMAKQILEDTKNIENKIDNLELETLLSR
jgi:peptide chain release factor 2